jgi:hypothetical protein
LSALCPSVCPSVTASSLQGVDRLGWFMAWSNAYEPRIWIMVKFFLGPVLAPRGRAWSPISLVFHKEINIIAIYGGLRDRCWIERGGDQKGAWPKVGGAKKWAGAKVGGVKIRRGQKWAEQKVGRRVEKWAGSNFRDRSCTWLGGFEEFNLIYLHEYLWIFYKCMCERERERVCVCMCVKTGCVFVFHNIMKLWRLWLHH